MSKKNKNVDDATRPMDTVQLNDENKSTPEGIISKTANAIVDKNKLMLVKESYKSIRTNIILSIAKSGCKKIVVASAVSGEGKSTTAANLATSLAQTDKKVLLIDTDLRKPSIYAAMGFSNVPGMTNVLTGLSTLDEAINETPFPNLHVLCAGIAVPNPGELLACEATAQFIHMLEEKYDYIMFDTPPVTVVADALPIIRMADGIVMVVRQNYSSYPDVDKAIQSIEFINGKIIGFVLNDVEDEHSKGGKYGNKYGKYYNQ